MTQIAATAPDPLVEQPPVVIGARPLTVDDLVAVADGAPVHLDPAALHRIGAAHDRVQRWGDEQRPIYGVSTGFGEMVHVQVPSRFKTGCRSTCSGGMPPVAGSRSPRAWFARSWRPGWPPCHAGTPGSPRPR